MKEYEVKIKSDGKVLFQTYIQNHDMKITAINQAVNMFTWQYIPFLVDGDLIIECNEVKLTPK